MKARKLAVVTVWMAAACFGAETKFTVVIFDHIGMPRITLKEAAETARRTFRAAGVATDWGVCLSTADSLEHCVLPAAGTYLEVKVVASSQGLESDGALGLALLAKDARSVVSYAFYMPVRELAAHTSQSISVVLAAVMAHEIGHLIGLRHNPLGIMKEKFERKDLLDASAGRLNFTTGEARALRAAANSSKLAQVLHQGN